MESIYYENIKNTQKTSRLHICWVIRKIISSLKNSMNMNYNIACISLNIYVMQKVSYVRKRNVYEIVRIQYFL